MNIGKSIKVALANKEMRATNLADQLAISRAHMSAIVNGHKQPTVMMLLSMAQIFGYSVSEFVALGEK